METPFEALTRLKKGSRPVIGCFPLYPPLELIHSMGLVPIVLWEIQDTVPHVQDADGHIQKYACSVSLCLAQLIMTSGKKLFDGLFFYNACDTLRNLPEILREGLIISGCGPLPIFRMHVPMTSSDQTTASDYLRGEIETCIRSLEKHYGVNFSEERFAESVSLYNRMRKLCMKLEKAVSDGRLPYADFSRTLMTINFLAVEEQIAFLKSKLADIELKKIPGAARTKVIVSGILPPPSAICEIIDQFGLRVVGNDVASQYRSYAKISKTGKDASFYYMHFYKNHFPCTTLLYAADRRIEAIENLVAERGANGFIFIGQKFCEYEYFEMPYLEKRLKDKEVTVLSIEISMDDNTAIETFRTRLEAFTEIISA
ncbi:MAG: 2-hydroxyacyl-CoA dehydratase family protein [Deltaproteobacteria bacterium]|nr:2-hydroxyacyl-CoA dehydratase family protein [Deltaproteobacteria bacterium]